jgi:ABC-type sulfate transport system permease subunit
VTATTYVLAGIAKLRLAGGAWLDGDQLRNQIAIDNLRKALLGDRVALFAAPLVAHPAALTALSIATLVVELGAPIALAGGVMGRAWAAAAWLFHVGVLLAMNILFPYALLGVAFLPLFPIERPLGRIAAWNARRCDAG